MKCLNCVTECDASFCPMCGQPTSTGRTNWRSFSTSSLADMLRFRGRFLNTCGELLTRPWNVIANYTAGRRVRYSSPLLFLLTLGIYSVLLESWFAPEKNIEHNSYVLRLYEFSSGMYTLCLLPPLIPALRIAYRRHGIDRFNTPELLTAGIFLSALSFLIGILFLPLEIIAGQSSGISAIVFIAYCAVSIFKAFPIQPMRKAASHFILFIVLAALFLIIYVSVLELIPHFILGPA